MSELPKLDFELVERTPGGRPGAMSGDTTYSLRADVTGFPEETRKALQAQHEEFELVTSAVKQSRGPDGVLVPRVTLEKNKRGNVPNAYSDLKDEGENLVQDGHAFIDGINMAHVAGEGARALDRLLASPPRRGGSGGNDVPGGGGRGA